MNRLNPRWIGLGLVFLLLPSSTRAGLVGYWNFDELSGTTAHNSVAGGVDGTLLGGASFVPTGGIRFGAIQFNRATNDLVSMGNNYSFASGSFSVVAWVKTTPGDTTGMIPLSKHVSGSANGYYLAVNDVGDGTGSSTNRAHFYRSGRSSGATSSVVNDGLWHMLAGVYDPIDNSVQIYVDIATTTKTSPALPMITNGADFLLGGLLNSGIASNAFHGYIDEVRVYDTALLTSDIVNVYLSTLPEPSGLCGSLVMASLLGWRRRSATRRVTSSVTRTG